MGVPNIYWEVVTDSVLVLDKIYVDKSIHVLFATFQSQVSDPGSGGLKIRGGVYQFCASNMGFPTMGASFERRNDQIWTHMHRVILSVNIFDK